MKLARLAQSWCWRWSSTVSWVFLWMSAGRLFRDGCLLGCCLWFWAVVFARTWKLFFSCCYLCFPFWGACMRRGFVPLLLKCWFGASWSWCGDWAPFLWWNRRSIGLINADSLWIGCEVLAHFASAVWLPWSLCFFIFAASFLNRSCFFPRSSFGGSACISTPWDCRESRSRCDCAAFAIFPAPWAWWPVWSAKTRP